MEIEIQEVKYDIRELSVGECLPIMESGKNAGLEMIKVAVSVKGKPIGEDVLDMGYSAFNELMKEVNALHGMTEGKKKGED